MSDKRLKSIADRIEKLMDDRDDIQSDIRDIYAEAKSAGYVPKVLRKAITRKRMDPDKRDEEDTILDLYEDALSPKMRRAVEMARGGATSREIEDETGIDHATVARSVALNKKSATVMTKADGVITETAAGRFPGGPGEDDAPLNLRVSEADGGSDREDGPRASGGEGVQRRAGCGTAGGTGQDVRDPGASVERDVGERGDHAPAGRDAAPAAVGQSLDLAHNEVQPPATPSVGAVASESERVAPQNLAQKLLGTFDEMPDQPAFLRRSA